MISSIRCSTHGVRIQRRYLRWIYVEKHVLHISGESKEKNEEKEGRKYLIKERRHTSFERSFSLPDGLDESAISAAFENGILTVRLPKLPEEKPRHIEVKIGK